ncbi:hydrophobic protein OSR8-like [Ananas comosus]|uniref:Hydrophobic protein OSR8 n=1 Tax=Ananas comosus TaxID=4615 RepID=A0A199V4H3_ANACO|nr:hydrophobic protein OSR8-like [Ananas comosus]OAY71987.1 Hydrophobic protein OSR8 [Ananas comosus]
MGSGHCCTFFEILLAIVLPPLGVFLRYGCCSCEFLIALLLTILGYIPGIIYAVYVIVAVQPDRPSRDLEEPLA